MRHCFAKFGFLGLCGVWVCVAAVPPATAAAASAEPPPLRLSLYENDGDVGLDGDGSRRSWLFVTPDADGARLWSQTRLMFGMGVAAVGVLYAMPESLTGWDRSVSIDEMPERWWRNVRKGPIWDNDHWFFNYASHPYCGGVYFVMARKSGYNQWDAFVYTFIMSTFFWEYGIESFAEVPSIQDLIVTPVGGWIYGEWAFRREQAIRANEGRFLGSKILGRVALFFIDPIDHFGDWVNRLVGREWVMTGSIHTAPPQREQGGEWTFDSGPFFQVGLERRF